VLSGRRGSVPITILVILTIALFAFALFAFAYASVKIISGVDEGYSSVAEFNVGLRNKDYLGESGVAERVEEKEKTGIFFGEEYLKISVQEIPTEGQ